jgi:hypothetical protein
VQLHRPSYLGLGFPLEPAPINGAESGPGITASSRPGFGTRRQEGSAVLLKASDGKLSDRPGGSRPVNILDECALVSAQKHEHRILGNRQNHLPTGGGCSGEARNVAR